MNLVIVESPAKGRTIEKYLGPDYKVMASFGHVRDLPEKELGVDVKENFKPTYVIPYRSKKTIAFLKGALKNSSKVYLATDFDREGEAIAWHVTQALGLGNSIPTPSGVGTPTKSVGEVKSQKLPVQRITFHEITKTAINEAVKNPREIDMNLVSAQQARRILDRLVGYKLSPFLWDKVRKGLSAGRVQSVALRLVVDREREIQKFKPQEYWTLEAVLANAKKENFTAILIEIDGKRLEKLEIKNEKQAQTLAQELEKANYKTDKIEKPEEQKWPFPPYTTSTLQQDASRRLGFSAKKTMKLAQDLYEAGNITYMRTDSTNLAWIAINSARKFIEEKYGKAYLPDGPRVYKTKSKGAQEAHEAIRPTYIQTDADGLKSKDFTPDHRNLYDLIWRRMLACQMRPAILEKIEARIAAKTDKKDCVFLSIGTKIKFDGFTKLYPMKIEEKTLPALKEGENLDLIELKKLQHFTESPPRYSEATLIKALEEHGIGRPSTYAPILSTIAERGYVTISKRVIFPEQIGFVVTDILKEHFPQIVDLGFTAEMEKDLDEIASGKKSETKILRAFYNPFEKLLAEKTKTVEKQKIEPEKTDVKCDRCGQMMVVRISRFGKFLGCSDFPKCRNIKPYKINPNNKIQITNQAQSPKSKK